MSAIPEILEKCVTKLKKQGKSESSAYAICTASLKKSGKLDDVFLDSLAEIEEGTFEFEEFETYLQENALLAWSAPTQRKDLPSSHFFDPKNKKYPYRNSDGSVNSSGVLAAWKLAHESRSGEKADSKIISRIQPYRDRCMKEKNKKQEAAPFRRFSSMVPESFIDSIQFGEKNPSIDIQCLRMGKFKHPWYGTLKFDQKFFENMVKNFEADIPNPEIAFDFRHTPDFGAAAWVSKTFIDGQNLMSTVTLTERGKDALKKKEFKYFSVEYTDDYVEYEFTEELDEKGNLVERESKISHGPTILGGAITNRPFIKGMLPVSLSETGEVIQLEEIVDSGDNGSSNGLKEVKGSMEKSLEELKAEQESIKTKIKELEEKKDGSSKEELDKLAVKLDEISVAVKELSEGGDEDATKTLAELDSAKEELKTANKKLEDKDKETKKLSDDVKALTETVKSLMKSNEVLHEDKYQISVEKKLGDFRKLGAFPSTIEVIKSMIFSEDVKKFSVKLSEGEGEAKKEVQKSFLDVVGLILESIPREHRFTDSELSESVITPTGSAKELQIEDVEERAKKEGITFEEALIRFSKEGKIVE